MPRLARTVFADVPHHVTDSLEKTFKPLHMRYAQWINRRKGWKGHLWQGRYFSSPLDEHYMWASIRYAELNPVRARMVDRAEDYSWSSAAAHCGIRNDDILSNELKQSNVSIRVDDWSSWLVAGENSTESALIKRNVIKGLPCGSEEFIRKLEVRAGKDLRFRPQGRPACQQFGGAGKV